MLNLEETTSHSNYNCLIESVNKSFNHLSFFIKFSSALCITNSVTSLCFYKQASRANAVRNANHAFISASNTLNHLTTPFRPSQGVYFRPHLGVRLLKKDYTVGLSLFTDGVFVNHL